MGSRSGSGGGSTEKNQGKGLKEELKQPKITDRLTRRKVTFVEEEAEKAALEREEWKTSLAAEMKKQLRILKAEASKSAIDLETRMQEISDTIDKLGVRLNKLEEKDREREEMRSAISDASGISGGQGASAGGGATGSQWSLLSGQSRFSACLSEREIKLMKRVVNERDRRERENNLVIKGWRCQESDLMEGVKNFFKEKIGFEGKVEAAWISGGVTVVKVGSQEKVEIMKRKSKLAGSRIFIENDLAFEDRKRQEDIHRWVREKKEKGYR